MEAIRGRRAAVLSRAGLLAHSAPYSKVALDLGAGDGKYVLDLARRDAASLAIGVDASREQLRDPSRRAPHNALFVIANALCLPAELEDLASEVTVNFPWGSLLRALLDGDRALFDGMRRVTRPTARLAVRLNGSALAQAGVTAEQACLLTSDALRANGWRDERPHLLGAAELRRLPSSWARRMAVSRAPMALELTAMRN